ncbi:MAG: hypothetical protein WA057_02275 [Candidatus Magasanikiibacteriota bacterium]
MNSQDTYSQKDNHTDVAETLPNTNNTPSDNQPTNSPNQQVVANDGTTVTLGQNGHSHKTK